MNSKGGGTVLKKLYDTIGSQMRILSSREEDSEEVWRVRSASRETTLLDGEDSPLDHPGPMPSEYLRDPYEVEVVPMTEVITPARARAKLSLQERTIWAAVAIVSWSITVVAILKVLRIL